MSPHSTNAGDALSPCCIRTILRQRDELDLVARHAGEFSFAPFVLGLLDALLARGNEVPPDMAGAVERCATDHRDAARLCRGQSNLVGRTEYEKLAGSELVARNVDFAGNNIDSALLAFGIERHHGAGIERDVGEQCL